LEVLARYTEDTLVGGVRKSAGLTPPTDEEPRMKKPLQLGVVFLLLAATTVGGSTPSERFIGAWRLAWLEEEGPDGKVHRADCSGMLVFTREGRMSVQVLYRDPQAGAPAGSMQYAQGGYEASFGRFEIDARAHTFTYHVEGALVRSLIGKDLTRLFELSGNQLIVKSSSSNERWRVAWEHE
jgi:hypothetical protein